jgi:hypothetical protein
MTSNDGKDLLKQASHRGLLKLMVRLPSVRGRLQMLATRSALSDLLEAYDEATSMLDRLERGQTEDDGRLLEEYRTIREEIESDVIRYCLEHR